jgi:exopolysaccharide biosynthesis protein PssK
MMEQSLRPVSGGAGPRSPANDHALIARLNARIDQALEGLIPRDRPYALLDFPHAPNVGDSLIWLGTLSWLRRHGYRDPCYTCSNLTFSPEQLRRRLGDGTIVLSGGGNFGDLYPTHERLRETVLEQFPDHPVVQLPQTIHFDSEKAMARARGPIVSHPRFSILVRGRESLRIVTEELGATARLCPDMAFALGPMKRPEGDHGEILWMRRRDKEAATGPLGPPPPGIRYVEWIKDWHTPLLSTHLFLARQLRHRRGLRPWLQGVLSQTYEPIARQRVERGCQTIGGGTFLITDRLHGHILALLMGIPHAVLDNAYGKVRHFYECWTSEATLARWCDSKEEALACAMAFTGGSPG